MITSAKLIPHFDIWGKFPKIKPYLKRYKLMGIEGERETKRISNLRRYTKEGSFKFIVDFGDGAYETQYGASYIEGELRCLSDVYNWHAIQAALSGQGNWHEDWHRAVAYAYWSTKVVCAIQTKIHDDFQHGRRPQNYKSLHIRQIGRDIGDLMALGWVEQAAELTQKVRHWLDHDGVNDGGDDYGRRRTQHFIIRLIANWQGWPEREGPACAFDEPVFNALIEHGRTPDLDLIAHLLLVACDRHTHQAREDGRGGNFFDLASSEAVYDPFEVLTVMRLRQLHGLVNPVLDHPLMTTPLGQLPDPPPFYTDALLDGVVARVRLEFPDM